MKNLLKLVWAIFIALSISGNAMAQTQKTATILNLGSNTINVDGENNGIWTNVPPIPIERFFVGESPSITATWKGAWNALGIYILVDINDNVWYPHWTTVMNVWESDHIELYFDVSDPQQDGGGPADTTQKKAGNWQIAPTLGITSGMVVTEPNGVVHSSTFDGLGKHTREFFVPYNAIQKNGVNINPLIKNVIGFDVSISDNDGTGRNRQVWSNDGTNAESWVSCDGVGLVTLSPTNIGSDTNNYAVTFLVDMRKPITDGSFIKGTDDLWMSGSMNAWKEPGLDPDMKMSESEIKGIYTITLDLIANTYTYKFFKNTTWANGDTYTTDRTINVNSDITVSNVWGYANDVNLIVADFSASKTTAKINESINFTDLSTMAPAFWAWDFGDGGSSALQNPTHAYSVAGIYTVTLTASFVGNFNTKIKTNYITVTDEIVAPVANFSATDRNVSTDEIVTFVDESLYNPTSWLWSFGDGTGSALQNPTHTYSKAGNYDVALTVTNTYGSDTETKSNYIKVISGDSPIADFTVDNSSTAVNEIINFTDLSKNNPTSWLWSFGDGETSEFRNPSHVYTSTGNFTVSLKASNSSGSNTEVKQDYIIVNAVGIKNSKPENWVQLFPNPSKGIFNLEVDKYFNKELSVQVIDAQGKIIYTKYKISVQGEKIDLSGYSKGIYFMQLSGSNYLQTEKLVVN